MEPFTSEVRLGDVIDDHCIKCRRITNHSIVSIVDGKAAKVRCRTCYHDHDYRHEQAPPSKKELKKAELFKEVLSSVAPGSADEEVPADENAGAEELPLVDDAGLIEEQPAVAVEDTPAVAKAPVAPARPGAKKAKGRAKKA